MEFFFFQAEDGIRDRSPSRGLGDVYKRQVQILMGGFHVVFTGATLFIPALKNAYKQRKLEEDINRDPALWCCVANLIELSALPLRHSVLLNPLYLYIGHNDETLLEVQEYLKLYPHEAEALKNEQNHRLGPLEISLIFNSPQTLSLLKQFLGIPLNRRAVEEYLVSQVAVSRFDRVPESHRVKILGRVVETVVLMYNEEKSLLGARIMRRIITAAKESNLFTNNENNYRQQLEIVLSQYQHSKAWLSRLNYAANVPTQNSYAGLFRQRLEKESSQFICYIPSLTTRMLSPLPQLTCEATKEISLYDPGISLYVWHFVSVCIFLSKITQVIACP
eukprot:TRINITY_DN1494_c0_g1_i15.p1 TRINITY_DN1494_c0_g1~~TRINITY_DN1494_c0_g1_i15.p1  ORF type:complete len:334 (-),score=48.17 TRINITY_DN1494_c0_g1_i15:91-1092(-)